MGQFWEKATPTLIKVDMKTCIIKVESCYDCPHSHPKTDAIPPERCGLLKSPLRLTCEILDNCPLPDSEDG